MTTTCGIAGEAGVVRSAFTSRLSARGSRHLAIRRLGSTAGVAARRCPLLGCDERRTPFFPDMECRGTSGSRRVIPPPSDLRRFVPAGCHDLPGSRYVSYYFRYVCCAGGCTTPVYRIAVHMSPSGGKILFQS